MGNQQKIPQLKNNDDDNSDSSDISFDQSLPSPSFKPYSIYPSDIETESNSTTDNDDDSIIYICNIGNNLATPPYKEIKSLYPKHAFFIQTEVGRRR